MAPNGSTPRVVDPGFYTPTKDVPPLTPFNDPQGVLLQEGAGTSSSCPCSAWSPAGCPPTGSPGACCRAGGQGAPCETQNWTPKTCVPPQGTWCTPELKIKSGHWGAGLPAVNAGIGPDWPGIGLDGINPGTYRAGATVVQPPPSYYPPNKVPPATGTVATTVENSTTVVVIVTSATVSGYTPKFTAGLNAAPVKIDGTPVGTPTTVGPSVITTLEGPFGHSYYANVFSTYLLRPANKDNATAPSSIVMVGPS